MQDQNAQAASARSFRENLCTVPTCSCGDNAEVNFGQFALQIFDPMTLETGSWND